MECLILHHLVDLSLLCHLAESLLVLPYRAGQRPPQRQRLGHVGQLPCSPVRALTIFWVKTISNITSVPHSSITAHSPTNSGSAVATKPGLASAKTALAAPPPLVIPSVAPALAPVQVENREARREKMMTLSRKFGTSRLAVSTLGIEGNFDSDEKAEGAVSDPAPPQASSENSVEVI